MFLVNSRAGRFSAPPFLPLPPEGGVRRGGGLILANLLSHFAEFLKSISAFPFVFSTCLLVSDWYSCLIVFIYYPTSSPLGG